MQNAFSLFYIYQVQFFYHVNNRIHICISIKIGSNFYLFDSIIFKCVFESIPLERYDMTLSRGIFLNMNEPDSQDVYNSVFTLVTVFLLEFLSKMKCWLGVNSKSSFLL